MSKENSVSVKAKCSDCGGSGVYTGWAGAEKQDGEKIDGVVCTTCDGNGWVMVQYVPFVERVVEEDIANVRLSMRTIANRHSGIWSGRQSTAVTYQEFLNGKRPEDVEVIVRGLHMVGAFENIMDLATRAYPTPRLCTHCRHYDQHWGRCGSEEARTTFGIETEQKVPDEIDGQRVGNYCPFWFTRNSMPEDDGPG